MPGKPEAEVLKRQVDGGDEGRLVFGAFRALRRGDGERAVGADEAVTNRPEPEAATVVEELPSADVLGWSWRTQQQVLAHLAGAAKGILSGCVPGDRVRGGAYRRTIRRAAGSCEVVEEERRGL